MQYQSDFKRRTTDLYKTALCKQFSATGACEYRGKCLFAHGEGELRPLPQGGAASPSRPRLFA